MFYKPSFKLTLVAAAAVLTCGCQTNYKQHIGDDDPGLGESVKYNAAAEIINPDPVYPPGAAQPGDNGAKATAAVTRYRTDAVKKVETMSSTQTEGGGSGGGGSGSGGSGSTR